MSMVGRYGRASGVANVCIVSMYQKPETRAETVVLSTSHAQISGPVLNFPRLLLAGGAAAARRRTSGTY